MKNILHIYTKCCRPGLIILLFCLASMNSCKKFVEVTELKNNLLAGQVFKDAATANAATAGVYKSLRGSNILYNLTVVNSVISDEVLPYTGAATNSFAINKLDPNDTSIMWSPYYTVIYAANSVIEGLTDNGNLPATTAVYYLGEAKFIRALMYFYLVNLYGDCPLILKTDVNGNNTMPRTPVAQVYAQIVKDLQDAIGGLGNDYSFTGGERSRANKWVAKALLARIYLYLKDYTQAEKEANDVITLGGYSLLNGPAGVFNMDNTEAIFQLANTPTEANNVASYFIYGTAPQYVCSSFLLNAFETGDQRKSTWIKTQTYAGQPVSFPYKFTTTATGSNEVYTMLRLAEMYLIRAEAKAMRNDFQGCIDDVNLIRQKHGGLSTALLAPANQTAALDVILHERQVDLFTEGCHRWFDLKRTGRLDAVMQAEKPTTWQSYAALYPIYSIDIQRNTNLKQNPGYE